MWDVVNVEEITLELIDGLMQARRWCSHGRVGWFIQFVIGEIWVSRIFAFLLRRRRFAYARTSRRGQAIKREN